MPVLMQLPEQAGCVDMGPGGSQHGSVIQYHGGSLQIGDIGVQAVKDQGETKILSERLTQLQARLYLARSPAGYQRKAVGGAVAAHPQQCSQAERSYEQLPQHQYSHARKYDVTQSASRSEEHTSELQSRENLV